MKHYELEPGAKIDLASIDPDDASAHPDLKTEAKAELERLTGRLEELQELLFAEHRRAVLVVLQGMDASGKDGVIRHVFEGVNPQGVTVARFKEPTEIERDHDYLWRVHQRTPARGEIAIFNRSHYEEVVTVRVHGLITREECKRRYEQINDFERTLVEEGTTILKFFLHLGKDEQKKRLEERLRDPKKRWKFRYSDLEARKHWDDYLEAYSRAVEATTTEAARWHVVPSNRKWYRNLVVARRIVKALEDLKMSYPEVPIDPVSVPID